MTLRFPDGEVRNYSDKLEEVYYQLLLNHNLEIPQLKLFLNDQLINEDSNLSHDDTIDVVISAYKNYAICSESLVDIVRNNGMIPLISPTAEVNNRNIKNINYTPRFYGNNYVYYKSDHLKEKSRNNAKKWYTPFENNKEIRQKEIKALLDQLPNKKLVISTFNEPYIVLFKNFIASCRENNIPIQDMALMFPMDNKSFEVCKELGIKAFYKDGVYGPTTSNHSGYGRGDFRICMFMKNAIIQDLLQLNKDFLFQDIDMVWLQDPIDHLSNLAETQLYDFMFMFDGGNPRFQPLYYNSGFCYVRSTDFSRRTWQVIFENFDLVLGPYGSQQVPVNMVMSAFRERGLRTNLLDEMQFFNGHLLTPRLRAQMRKDTMVVHVSWTGNLSEKIKKLKENGLWYLKE